MINEFSTALNLVDSGRIDLQLDTAGQRIAVAAQKAGFRQVQFVRQLLLRLQREEKTFDDVRVRRAFVMAGDRGQITELLAAGNTPLTGWIPLGMFGYDPHRGLKFDPARARKLLAEAGFPDGKKLPRVTIASTPTKITSASPKTCRRSSRKTST